MNKIIYLALILSITACSKNELSPTNNLITADMGTKAIVSTDIASENGYLIVKDFQTLDSLISKVTTMTNFERLTWENKMNFESAFTHFKSYFNIFDTITSESSLYEFKQKYQNIISITFNGENWNVDYPFKVENLEFVLSKDGKIKIGSTLWIYKADRKINIHNVTEEKVTQYGDTKSSVPSKEISVYYFEPSKLRYGRESNAEQLIHFPKLPREDKREYYASLDILKREYKNGAQISHRRYLALYQQGKKKKTFGGYNVYKTTYWVIISSIKFSNWEYVNTNKISSPEHKGGIYCMLGYVEGQAFPRFSISLNHGSRGYSLAPTLYYDYAGSGLAVPVINQNTVGY